MMTIHRIDFAILLFSDKHAKTGEIPFALNPTSLHLIPSIHHHLAQKMWMFLNVSVFAFWKIHMITLSTLALLSAGTIAMNFNLTSLMLPAIARKIILHLVREQNFTTVNWYALITAALVHNFTVAH
jgi:hypothetical protein